MIIINLYQKISAFASHFLYKTDNVKKSGKVCKVKAFVSMISCVLMLSTYFNTQDGLARIHSHEPLLIKECFTQCRQNCR